MILLLGQSGSGKDTVKKMLTALGLRVAISYTTRPMRKGEVNGIDYHFISEDDFISRLRDDFFAEHNSFDTASGTWYYGTAKEDCIPNAIKIVEPSGFRQLKEIYGDLIHSIYVKASDGIRLDRLCARGDSPQELIRRMFADKVDFEGIEQEVDSILVNEGSYNDLANEIERIFKFKEVIA